MYKSPRLKLIILVYWVLLAYIVAALIWWFIALQTQNNNMTELLLNEQAENPHFGRTAQEILDAKKRKTAQYIGEGATFFILIMVGAVFVYRATRRQLRLSMQQQNFMMAVTHELKTPIAVTRLNIETLQRRTLEEEQRQKLIGNTLNEVGRLNTLCNNILLASRMDAGKFTSEKTQVNLSELVQRVSGEIKSRYSRRTILTNIAPNVTVLGEDLLLELLLSNLAENALKYAPPDQPVTIELLSGKDNAACLKVKDNGPGIPADEREKVFDKFYRIGSEQTRTAKGTGLGLYLCKQIAKAHKATIKVSDNEGGGAIFAVQFAPLAGVS